MGFRIRFRFTQPLKTVNLCEVIITFTSRIESIGIKRIKTEGRTIKLERKCRVLYTVFLLQQCPYNKAWTVIAKQDIITEILNCGEQTRNQINKTFSLFAFLSLLWLMQVKLERRVV